MGRLLTLLAAALVVLALSGFTSHPDGKGTGRPHGPANVDGLGLDRPGHPDDAFGEDYVGDDEDRSAKIEPDEDDDFDGLDARAEERLGTDPREGDSDGDGLLDGEEDPDGDSVTSEEEERVGLDPARWDLDRYDAANTREAGRTR